MRTNSAVLIYEVAIPALEYILPQVYILQLFSKKNLNKENMKTILLIVLQIKVKCAQCHRFKR